MRIGAYQFAISGDVNENYKEIEKAIYLAKHKDVQLLIFPECSLTGYPPRDISNSSCVNFNLVQSMCDRLQSVADQNDISFIVGTIFKEKEIYNRALLFQPNKQIKSYDKRALWGWDNDNFAKGNSDGMTEEFFKAPFVKNGIQVVIPSESELKMINKKISTELELGIIKEETLLFFQNVINRMKNENGIEAIVLGCTELPLLLNDEVSSVPCLDTMQIHISSIIKTILDCSI